MFSKAITEIIAQRFSCRAYLPQPIAAQKRQHLEGDMAALQVGPLGSVLRFRLLAATEEERDALRGLGAYGFIKGAQGFIAGAVQAAAKGLEDYGYGLEQLVLRATDLELGTCWLGGSFTRSSFARRVVAGQGEQVPAVAAVGYIANVAQARGAFIRRQVKADHRLPWEKLFYRQRFDAPLTREEAGAFAVPLEMVRLGPSASNKQPWRVVQEGSAWHFYLQRTRGYGGGGVARLLGVADMQRVDIGIAMCHFALTAQEIGLGGRWVIQEPNIARPDVLTEYTVSWVS